MTGGTDDPLGLPLRRHPSLTHTTRPHSPTSPVYENLPQRCGTNRWAYDSLRASHKFYWGSVTNGEKSCTQKEARTTPKLCSLDDTSEGVLSTSFNTASSRCSSLNTSLEGEGDLSREGSAPLALRGSSNKPAALEFWQDLQMTERPSSTSKISSEDNERESPFRYKY